MSVHYKFKSGKDKHTVIFDGLHISVADLKKAIMQQRKIGKSADLDLQIINPQTGEVYGADSALIPKNTSVEVARVPISGSHKKSWDRHDLNSTKGANSPSHMTVENITKSSSIATSYTTEEEKIKAMMSQSTQEYDPSKYVKNRGPIGPLPANYTCYRCGQPGHYIKQCPTNNTDVKRSTGIPRSFMIPANADQKGAMLTASGDYAVPIIDHEAYKEIKKEKPPFMPSAESDKEEVVPEIPDDLKCTLCQDLLQDAVLIPCCGNSYCDECIRTALLESESHQCPTCHELNVSPDTLIPNRYLRTSVNKFKNDTGYHKDRYMAFTRPKASAPSARPVVEQNKVNDNNSNNNNNNKEEEVIRTDEKINQIESTVNEFDVKSLSPPSVPQSPVIEENPATDVSMDEVILGSPKLKGSLGQKSADIGLLNEMIGSNDLDDINDSNEDGNESRVESTTGSNTPLVDEPSEAYEVSTETTAQTEATPVTTLAPFPTQPLVSMSSYPRPTARLIAPSVRTSRTATMGQQSNPTLLGRPPAILPHPRGPYSRPPGLSSYRPMGDPRGYNMPMSHTMGPYGYAPQMAPPAYHDPYGYMGPRSHMPTGPMHHSMGMTEAPPPGSAPIMTDSVYPYPTPDYDDYEDKFQRFQRSLETRSRGRRRPVRSISRSRSRSRHTRSSRSRSSSSSSGSSSTSSSRSSRFSFSSRSFSDSSRSRSRSHSPRRRSLSRGRYRRRSRSRSPRNRDYGRDRYRRSRSPRHNEVRRYRDRSRGRYEREREAKYRDSRSGRYERNESSYRSNQRSDDKRKESKANSKSTHKSSEDKSRHKEVESRGNSRPMSGTKTPLRDETIDKSVENVVKTEAIVENKESIEVKVENESNKGKESVSESKAEKDRPTDTDDKTRGSDKKRSKDRSKKHHKHHHHNHHKHRKTADELVPKDSKKSEESSSNRRSKKSKKTSDDKEPMDQLKSVRNENVKSELKPVVSNAMAPVETVAPIVVKQETPLPVVCDANAVEEYEPEMPAMKTSLTDFSLESNTFVANAYEVINESELKSEENIDFNEYVVSTDIPVYSSADTARVEESAPNEVLTSVDKELVVLPNDGRPLNLVDYTDNEELAEPNSELMAKQSNDTNSNNINEEMLISCENVIKNDSPIDSTVDATTGAAIEVPKSKWDEDMNDLRLEKSGSNERRHKSTKSDDKSSKTQSTAETNDSEKPKDRTNRESDRNRSETIETDGKPTEDMDDSAGLDGADGLPRKVRLDRSKFTEKPTLSITIDNSEKESKRSRDRRSDDKDSKSHSSAHYKSSRDRSKDRERESRTSHRKKSSKSGKSRDDSRHRSHKRSRRSRSRSSSSVRKTDKRHSSRSRSRSHSPRRQSLSRGRSRSRSPRNRDYGRDRYRRSRSPRHNEVRRYRDRSRGRYEREREAKYRDSRSGRYERNESSYRSNY